MERGLLTLTQRPRLIPTTCPMVMDIQLMGMDMVFTERGLLMLSQRPSLMSMEDTTDTQLTDTTAMERGLLMLSLRPRLIPTTCPMVMDIQLMGMDMVFTERGLLMLSRKPNLITMEDTTDTLLTDTTSMES